jgi:hypothetical protein
MEVGLHEIFKVFVLENHKGKAKEVLWVSALFLFALSMSRFFLGFFCMETLCSHVLHLLYDLLASTIYSKKELQSFSFFVCGEVVRILFFKV